MEFIQVSPNLPTTFAYGRGLSPHCSDFYTHPSPWPCNLDLELATFYLVGYEEGYNTVNNVSTVNQLVTVEYSGLTYVFLGNANVTGNIDYSASTVAVNTQCIPASRACNLTSISRQSAPYRCSENFTGDVQVQDPAATLLGPNSWRMDFFNDTGLVHPVNLHIPTNPTYIAMAVNVAGNGETSNGPGNGSLTLSDDPEIVNPCCLGGSAFILQCNTTAYEATYTWFNGSFKTFLTLTLANTTVANIINGPQQNNLTFGVSQYLNGAILASLSNTSQILADKMALVYSQTALGLAAGTFSPRNNLEEQHRDTILATRVPVAPFYAIIALDLCYAVTVALLAFLALRANGLDGVREVQAQLSIGGLIQHGFQRPIDDRDALQVENATEGSHIGTGKLNVIGVEKINMGDERWSFNVYDN
jgi:hypothetical protein